MTYNEQFGGIPPDDDHKALFICSYPRCIKTDEHGPLIVVGHGGKMRSYCREHLDLLTPWSSQP